MHEEFRYKCTMCSSSFNQEGLLKKHIQRHIDGRYLTCPVEGCNEGFTIKNQLTRHMQTHHSIKNCTQRISVKRLKMSNYVRSAASGKYNCYFESCDGSFTDEDTLNNHLRGVHGLSIVKNAGKRSKMDLMLLEQMKQQEMEQQGSSSFTDGGDGGFSQEVVSSASCQSVQEIQVQPDVSHLIDGPIQNQPEVIAESPRVGCNFCFHVFKTEAALNRHTAKFHSVPEAN